MFTRTTIAVLLGAAAVSVAAELIGTRHLDLGPGQVIFFPIIWAILIAGALSFQRLRPMPVHAQVTALDLVGVGIMMFLVFVGITVGSALETLMDVTWVLALQEFVHLFGTVIVALPLAVALRMGRSSIGATYSIDREANLAYTAERYGAQSAEYRGTLGVYVFGSVFGALYLSVLAGYVSSAGWLDPLALAMGSGVGSGSMMAAAAAAIGSDNPGLEDKILAYASASNLMTQTIGTFVTCFVALPLAERMYRVWCRVFRVPERMKSDAVAAEAVVGGQVPARVAPSTAATAGEAAMPQGPSAEGQSVDGGPGEDKVTGLARMPIVLAVFVGLMTLSNAVATRELKPGTVLAIAGMAAVTYAAFAVNRALPRIPVLLTTVVVGALAAAPFSPVEEQVLELFEGISFISLVTPVLALVGLSLGKERAALAKLSWRVVLIALVSFGASFLLAAAAAQPFL